MKKFSEFLNESAADVTSIIRGNKTLGTITKDGDKFVANCCGEKKEYDKEMDAIQHIISKDQSAINIKGAKNLPLERA